MPARFSNRPLLSILSLAAIALSSAGCVPVMVGAAAGASAGKRSTRNAATATETCALEHPDWGRLVCTHIAYRRYAPGMTLEQIALIDRRIFEKRQVGDVEHWSLNELDGIWVEIRTGRVVACKGSKAYCAPPLPAETAAR